MNVPMLILLVVFLIALSAFFSSTEIAFAQASKPRIKSLAEEHAFHRGGHREAREHRGDFRRHAALHRLFL